MYESERNEFFEHQLRSAQESRRTVDRNASGSAAVGAADTGGRGRVAGNALEESNVDLEKEFVTMITAQRIYQANARMLDTANSTLQELVQLV